MLSVVAILLLASFVPIWRPASGWDGMNFWEYIATTAFVDRKHVTIEQGIEDARKAYCDVMGLDYEQSYSEHYYQSDKDTIDIGLLSESMILGSSLLSMPIWKCGSEKNITGWKLLHNHTFRGPAVTVIPEERYYESFSEKYNNGAVNV